MQWAVGLGLLLPGLNPVAQRLEGDLRVLQSVDRSSD